MNVFKGTQLVPKATVALAAIPNSKMKLLTKIAIRMSGYSGGDYGDYLN